VIFELSFQFESSNTNWIRKYCWPCSLSTNSCYLNKNFMSWNIFSHLQYPFEQKLVLELKLEREAFLLHDIQQQKIKFRDRNDSYQQLKIHLQWWCHCPRKKTRDHFQILMSAIEKRWFFDCLLNTDNRMKFFIFDFNKLCSFPRNFMSVC
jgi:hypothetical protein